MTEIENLGIPDVADPFELFADWFKLAAKTEPIDSNAMSLATVDPSGLPNVRTVLLKEVVAAGGPARGFVFYTNIESAKGREIGANPAAAILLYWKSLSRQVRARGPLTPVSSVEADAYFASRPRMSRIGAWASAQSRPLESREALEALVEAYSEKFPGEYIPRPPHWSGYRLTPLEIEFWEERPFRLHDRLVFRREGPQKNWQKSRLCP